MTSFFATLLRFLLAFARSLRDPEFRALLIVAASMLLSGTIFYSRVEGWSLVDSLYFSVITLTTIRIWRSPSDKRSVQDLHGFLHSGRYRRVAGVHQQVGRGGGAAAESETAFAEEKIGPISPDRAAGRLTVTAAIRSAGSKETRPTSASRIRCRDRSHSDVRRCRFVRSTPDRLSR